MEPQDQGPPAEAPITRIRVLERRPAGVHVRVEMADGRTRTAWVASAVLDDARRQLLANQDLVAATDGGEALGPAAVNLIAILSTQVGAGYDEALYEASWVGPAPDELPPEPSIDRVPRHSAHASYLPPPAPVSERAIRRTGVFRNAVLADQESSAVHPHLGRGAVVASAYQPDAEPEPPASTGSDLTTLALVGMSGAFAAMVGVFCGLLVLYGPEPFVALLSP